MAEQATSPVSAGLRRRCPRCGEGHLFRGFLSFEDECEACGLNYKREDVGDGPVAFIVLIVGFAVVIPALIIEVAYGWPVWAHLLVWLPLVVILSLILMPIAKALFFAMQYSQKAEEGRLDES